MKPSLLFGLTILLISAAAPAMAATTKPSLQSMIDAGNGKWVAAFNAGDAMAMSKLYTEQATLLPAGAPMAVGRPAIAQFWGAAIKSGLKNPVLTTIAVENYGRAAREIGKVTLDVPGAGGATTHVEGKYVVVWKHTPSGWELDSDIWNLDK
jgi:ketosteroid isomerase-like protein